MHHHRASGFSRRHFVASIASGSLLGAYARAADAHATIGSHQLPDFDGQLWFDPASRRRYAQDYGQIVHEPPLAILHPGSTADLERIVAFAREAGVHLAIRGAGHQPFGQAQLRGGIVIDMRSLARVHSIVDDRIEVDVGAEWRSVVRAALTRGLTPPVLTNYPSLTVGGTLSIGGVGATTFRDGAQIDQTLALDVVTGTGEHVSCSEASAPDLFETVLAGEGQVAIMTRAALRLVRAPEAVREYTLPYADLETLMNDGTLLAGDERFHGLVGVLANAQGKWSYALIVTRQFSAGETPDDAPLLAGLRFVSGKEQIHDVPYAQYVDRVPPFDPGQAHADLGLCVPGSTAPFFVSEMLPQLTPYKLGNAQAIRMYFWQRAPFGRPLLQLPREKSVVYLAILRGETSDRRVIWQQLAGNRTLFERNRNVGGTLYPFAAVELTRRDWRRHYGESWKVLADAKRRYDPDDVFASGPGLEFGGR